MFENKKDNIVDVYEDNSVRIQRSQREGECVLIAFTGVGHAMAGMDIQKPEFLSATKMGKVIWITDKNRTWGNGLDIEKIVEIILLNAKGKDVYCIGNSMGGFLAILFSKYINAKKVLSVVPQWSIDPNIVPNETRWLQYRQNIKNIKYPDLSGSFNPSCDYLILSGNDQLEKMQTQHFLQVINSCNIKILEFEDAKHNVAHYLKEKNILSNLLTEFFSNNNIDFESMLKDETATSVPYLLVKRG